MNILTFAYLDPGTGSFVIQLIAAFFLTAGAGAAVFWKRLKTKLFGKGKTDEE